MVEPLSAIVLAGGASRRLGQDKAALIFGGRPLLHIVIDRLASVCDEIIVAGGQRPAGPLPVHVRFVPDTTPGQGPISGVQAGLAAASADFAFVVACDMPFLSPALLAFMAGLPRDYQALVPEAAGRRHPLHAIYARSCLPVIDSLLARGRNSMAELLEHLDVRVVTEADIGRLDPRRLSLFNLNGRDELQEARRLWEDPEPATPARTGPPHGDD